MRDPAATKAEIEAAIEAACEEFRWLKEHWSFPKKYPDEPDALLRDEARNVIKRLPDEVIARFMSPLMRNQMKMKPAHLRDYVCGLLSKTPNGLRRTYAAGRDKQIAEVVDGIVERGFPPTRNEATREKEKGGEAANQSACSIVAKALERIGVDIAERTVEDIYARSFAPESWEK